jgi:tripartite-type tricarboxylate transporter receptor subunit TctC
MHRAWLVLVAATMAASVGVHAEGWPDKPIHAVIPFGAGSASDVVPRIVYAQLSSQLGQQVVVENRGGAHGHAGTLSAFELRRGA